MPHILTIAYVKQNPTRKTKVKESTGRLPDLQDRDRAFITRSKRDSKCSTLPEPPVRVNSSESISLSSITINRNAVAISRAQLQRGDAVHLASFTRVSYATSPTMGDRSKGLTNVT